MTRFRFELRMRKAGGSPPFAVCPMKCKRQPISPELQRLQRLLDPGVSLERAYTEIHAAWFNGRAAASTVEALVISLRAGVSALSQSGTLRRLAELSDAQLREVAVRLQKLNPEIAPPWTTEDVEVLIAVRSGVHGR
jgi:hypothetical protein